MRGEPAETRSFFEAIDAQVHELSVKWHTFDLDGIEEKTEAVLQSVRTKREEVAKTYKRARAERAGPSSN